MTTENIICMCALVQSWNKVLLHFSDVRDVGQFQKNLCIEEGLASLAALYCVELNRIFVGIEQHRQ